MIVVVLGAPHSGTSIFARILHQLGVYMGDDVGKAERTAKGAWNQRSANYEDLGLWELNLELIRATGKSWDDLPSVEETWEVMRDFGARMKAEITARNHREVWGFKLLLVSCTAEVWHHWLCIFGSPRYVVVHREIPKVVVSMRRRFDNFSRHQDKTDQDWTRLVASYCVRIGEFLEVYHPPALHVYHEELIDRSKAESVVRSMAEFCDLSFSQEAMEGIEYGI